MQVVILAAGRGERFGELTEEKPKCLIEISGKPIIFHILESLPEAIKEVVMVVKYQGEKIREVIGEEYKGRVIKYVEATGFNGTAGALWDAQAEIKDEFLVLNSDDIIPQRELTPLLQHKYAFGVAKHIPPRPSYFEVVIENDLVKKLERIGPEKVNREINIATGTYKLDKKIFTYEPVPIKDGREYGLPQTIMKLAAEEPVQACLIENWLSINNPEELAVAERELKNLNGDASR